MDVCLCHGGESSERRFNWVLNDCQNAIMGGGLAFENWFEHQSKANFIVSRSPCNDNRLTLGEGL